MRSNDETDQDSHTAESCRSRFGNVLGTSPFVGRPSVVIFTWESIAGPYNQPIFKMRVGRAGIVGVSVQFKTDSAHDKEGFVAEYPEFIRGLGDPAKRIFHYTFDEAKTEAERVMQGWFFAAMMSPSETTAESPT